MKIFLYDTEWVDHIIFNRYLQYTNRQVDDRPKFSFKSRSDQIIEISDDLYAWIKHYEADCNIVVESKQTPHNRWYLDFKDENIAVLFKLTWV